MFNVSKRPYQSAQHLQVDPLPPCWTKMELKNYSTTVEKSLLVDRFWCLRCLNNPIHLPDIIGLLASGATAFLVPKNKLKNYLCHLKTKFDFQGV